MKKKFKAIFALGCIGFACMAAGCTEQTELEKYQKQGYTVSVVYDGNGGTFLSSQGATLMDLFKPSDYTKDEEGKVHIKLVEPTDPIRPSPSGAVTLTKSGHFFMGWYQSREILKNEEGKVVDYAGVELDELEGVYYYPGSDTIATPAYTYEGYWDFEEDTIDYSEDQGLYSITLYAAWVPYFEFNFYYENPSDEQEWTLIGTTTFDYKTANEENSKTADKDTIWLPDWKDGAMNHSYRYANGSSFEFPSVMGYTFHSAYTDAACTQEITEKTFTHTGTLDFEVGRAVDRVQNIYVKYDQGLFYKIEKAEQLVANANPTGNYEILADLDFAPENGVAINWPTAFEAGTFTGKLYSTEGHTYKIKNVTATHTSSTSTYGGLFGCISKDAVISNVTFENVTFDLYDVFYGLEEPKFGLFAGYVEEGATVTGITVTGSMIRIGYVDWMPNYKLNLICNGATVDVTVTDKTKLRVYGYESFIGYDYKISRDITVDEKHNVCISALEEIEFDNSNPYYDIEY